RGQDATVGARRLADRTRLGSQLDLARLLHRADDERRRLRHSHRLRDGVGVRARPRPQGPERGHLIDGAMHEYPWQLQALRTAAIAVISVGVFAAMYVVASAPTRIASRLGMRGLRRHHVIATS